MNLILCYTPLQVLIAEKIIERYPTENFYGVMLCSVNNAKFEYYRERLAQKCQHFFSFIQRTDRIGLFKQILCLKYQFHRKKFDNVFIASINDIQMQFILSSIRFDTLYTFDDGTANIVPSSVYYQPEVNTPIRRNINKYLRNKFNAEKIKKCAQLHYTIYPQFTNIIKNTAYIDLSHSSSFEGKKKDAAINILLGQPVYLDNDKNIELANGVIKRFNIDYYLPHPREQYQLENVTYINTPLIFEDYISQQTTDKQFRIYTYFSSAVLNVMSNSNLDIYALRINVDKQEYLECYELFEKVGINIIDITEDSK
ncbi:CMP-N-acetylneuraminate-beta-galactosamide-alpha-2, 3-sialyltransferase [[Actinobacillus] muris]|uniref:CMP-N-acetylneuraminate-beta-galactosamide-alpha-2, 3-sialyltransferase n=1 Tax=Muribacter muris TaxID=67855 RepID=A0A0J5P3J3_9PAST|nr:glycosyltransferase family 52 [Muribacter muris]KMK50821.1 CMP-N-acetylneuraminate-beta-galactosamide-alpha-2, 3-sialyltransferase [[Actinobacillus] muris] [Muribacter muris]